MIRFLQTPGPTKKIVLGGLLLLICAAMVITLVPGGVGSSFGLGGPGQGVVARVGSNDITTLEVQQEARRMLKQQFPRGGAQVSMLLPFFTSRAAENLINQKAVLEEADRLGLHATDEELRDELQHGRYAATFFPGGNFIGQDEYLGRLQQAELTVPQFEQGVKDEILFDKLRNLVTGGAAVTDADVRREFERRNAKVKFEYAVLGKDDILKAIHPGDAELKAFYERNKASYNNAIPEKRKVRYVLLDSARIEAQTPVTRADLQAYYDQRRDEFRVPEQVNVRQILIKTPLPGADGKVDPKGVEEARKKAEDVFRQLKAGSKFEDLAKKYSDDPSGKNGGSAGWVQHFPVPAVDKAAYALPKGGTSDVIDAGYAFVILHVDDKQQAHLKPLDEVKGQVEPIIKRQKATRAAEGQANALLTQARAGDLEKAAAGKGLQVVSTDFISRTDSLPGIGPSPQLTEAIFNQPEKAPAEDVQLAQGYVVFDVPAIKPPATPTFEEIRSRVETEFKNERSGALLSQKTQELSDRAKAGHDLKKAARELGATVKTSDFVLPDGQVPDIGSMSGGASVAFTMKPGEISGPIDNGTTGAVLSVLEKQDPSAQDFAAKQDQIRDSLLQNKQQELFSMFLNNLRIQMEKSGKIKVNQDEMKNLTKGQGGAEGE
jgi:peptidyl-prolyl cis-trans isomerase D